MNSETQITEDQQPANDESSDWLLQILVRQVNAYGWEMGITLQVSGMLVSGLLIGGKTYFETFASDFASGVRKTGDEESAEVLRKAWASNSTLYEPGAILNGPPPRFIHLRNAKYFHPSGTPLPTKQPVLWRGRLSEVAGFTLGTFGIAE